MFKKKAHCLLASLVMGMSSSLVTAQEEKASDSSPKNIQKPSVEIFVTTTREAKSISQLSESVGVLSEEELGKIAPSHPAEALNRIPGVHINNLGGEGHMSSIRQPITTSGVYLFLEDGIPTRPSGFFNHNGLYEINIPQSSRVEVVKGPGSALYGSDAIGGMINVITKPAPEQREMSVRLEGGSFGWMRGLLSGGGKVGDNTRVRVDYNYTESEGFRDASDYDRNSFSLRSDSDIGDDWTIKAIAAYSEIDQSGVSSLEDDDYKNNTTYNFYQGDIGARQVEALRVSMEVNYSSSDDFLATLTPYYRKNAMLMMPSWMVTYDPNIRDYDFESYGFLSKFRSNFAGGKGEVIIGLDIDHTPSSYQEEGITVDLVDGVYLDYARTGVDSYLFDTLQKSFSPYLHSEYQLSKRWRINAGLRFDKYDVDYINYLSAVADESSHLRPASGQLSYEQTSPKFGLIVDFADGHNAYVNYRYSFRAPTAGALYRSGSSQGTTYLNPVEGVSAEIGFRGEINKTFSYELAYYDMTVEDDIVSIIDGDDRKSVNAGETQHKGFELGFDWRVSQEFQLGVSYTATDQKYKNFNCVLFDRSCFCNREINFAGNNVSKAPRSLANVRLGFEPKNLDGLRVELEWVSVGEYFTDQTNTQTYDGHDVVNLRLNYEFSEQLSMFGRAANITDELYSTYTSNQVNDPDISYRPGKSRSLTLGLNWVL